MWVSNDRLSPPEVWEETAGLLRVCVCVCVRGSDRMFSVYT